MLQLQGILPFISQGVGCCNATILINAYEYTTARNKQLHYKKTLQIKAYSIPAPSDIIFRDPLPRQKINGTKNTSDPKAQKELFSQDQNNAVKHKIMKRLVTF